MSVFLLGVYIALIFIRPQEWIPEVKNWALVNYAALATLFSSMPRFLQDHQELWRRVPQVRVAIIMLFGVTFCYLPQMWLFGMRHTFQEFGKVVILYLLVVLLARNRPTFQMLLWIILLCVAWMAIHGVLEIHRGFGFGGQKPMWRKSHEAYQIVAYGIFDDPNDLCMVFVFTLPLLIAAYRTANNAITKSIALA